MSMVLESLMAAVAVFVGSLIADIVFGDGIQTDDLQQAATVAIIAAIVQVALAGNRRR